MDALITRLPILDTMAFHVAVGATLALDAALLAFLAWAFHRPSFERFHIRAPMPMKGVSRRAFLANISLNGALSGGLTLALIYGLSPWTITAEEMPVWQIALQGLAALVVYDFGYYFLHRLMHHRRLMPLVHAVHHRARVPTALESLYQSPIELLAGLSMFSLAVWVVGPIHWAAFVGVFFVFSTLNIVIHSGMVFPHPVFRPINAITEKHYRHHYNKHGHNYASVTPLPDRLFGTSF